VGNKGEESGPIRLEHRIAEILPYNQKTEDRLRKYE
jgi:hypothetical protein